MLNVTCEIGDTCGESPYKNDKDKKTTKAMGTMTASGYNSTLMCHIRPHKWENEIGNAFLGFDLALSGCVDPPEINTQCGGCIEKEKIGGCSSGSGSDNVSSMLVDVRMYSTLGNVYGTLDDVSRPMDNARYASRDVYCALDTTYSSRISVMMYEYVPTEDTYDISMRGMHNLPMVRMYELGQSCAQASTTIASGVYCYRAYQKFHVDARAGSVHVESTASRCEGFAYWIRYVTHDNESIGCDDASMESGHEISPIGPILLNGPGRAGTGPTGWWIRLTRSRNYGHGGHYDPRGREA
jgi:hypothetical protein